MLSKARKHLKFLPQLFTVLGAVSMAFALMLSVVNMPVQANGVIQWQGNGSNNLPCVDGNAQWNFTGGQGLTSVVLTVNGSNYGMSLTGGVWKALVFGLSVVNEAYVTYTGDLGQGNSVLTISHCEKAEATPTTPPNTPTFTATFTPTNTPVSPTATFTATNTPTNTPVSPTATFTATNTPIPDEPEPTPTEPAPTDEPEPTPTEPAPTDEPEPTPTDQVVPEDPDPTSTPVPDETPDPTEPPVVDETPEPTLAPPVSNDPPTVLIPVTGVELGVNSPLSDLQNFVFNMGLTFLGLGLILQSVRKRFNF